jgi:hypothetical protein
MPATLTFVERIHASRGGVVTGSYHIPNYLRPTELAMKTTNTTAAAGCILAIDLGKFKSVACLYPTTAEAEIR